MELLATDAPQGSFHTLGQPFGAGSATSRANGPVVHFAPTGSDLFWKKYPGLVWSNRHAGDAVRIRAALMRPLFPVLLDIAARFGVNRLECEWATLRDDSETDTRRVEPTVSHILANIRRGYEQASA